MANTYDNNEDDYPFSNNPHLKILLLFWSLKIGKMKMKKKKRIFTWKGRGWTCLRGEKKKKEIKKTEKRLQREWKRKEF